RRRPCRCARCGRRAPARRWRAAAHRSRPPGARPAVPSPPPRRRRRTGARAAPAAPARTRPPPPSPRGIRAWTSAAWPCLRVVARTSRPALYTKAMPATRTPMRPSTPPPTIPALDLPRYLGTWYEIARLPMRHEPADYTDITAHYALDADGSLQVRNRALDGDGELQESIGRATVPDPAHPARLKVTFLPQGLRWLPFGKGDYWILEL